MLERVVQRPPLRLPHRPVGRNEPFEPIDNDGEQDAQVLQVETTQVRLARDCGPVDGGERALAFGEERPARLDIGPRGRQHRLDLGLLERLPRFGLGILSGERIEGEFEPRMHELRPMPEQPREELLYARPDHVAGAFAVKLSIEPGDERAQHCLIDLLHRRDGPIVSVKELEPDARVAECIVPGARRARGVMMPERQRDLRGHPGGSRISREVERLGEVAGIVREVHQ